MELLILQLLLAALTIGSATYVFLRDTVKSKSLNPISNDIHKAITSRLNSLAGVTKPKGRNTFKTTPTTNKEIN